MKYFKPTIGKNALTIIILTVKHLANYPDNRVPQRNAKPTSHDAWTNKKNKKIIYIYIVE